MFCNKHKQHYNNPSCPSLQYVAMVQPPNCCILKDSVASQWLTIVAREAIDIGLMVVHKMISAGWISIMICCYMMSLDRHTINEENLKYCVNHRNTQTLCRRQVAVWWVAMHSYIGEYVLIKFFGNLIPAFLMWIVVLLLV